MELICKSRRTLLQFIGEIWKFMFSSVKFLSVVRFLVLKEISTNGVIQLLVSVHGHKNPIEKRYIMGFPNLEMVDKVFKIKDKEDSWKLLKKLKKKC